MIRHLVLDMGNVLIHFDPMYFILREGITDKASQQAILREVFRSPHWVMLDRGVSDEPDLLAYAKTRLPEELHPVVERIMANYDKPIRPMEGMEQYVKDCKAQGLDVYLLSNASHHHSEYWPRVPGSELCDGVMVSAYEHLLKPQPEIYLRFLSKFGLKAEECLFIDDQPTNIEGAMYVGMNGIVFDGDVDWLRAQTREFGVQV